LNSNEEAIEIRNLKFSAMQWSEAVTVLKVESSVSDSTASVLSRKDGLENSVKLKTWPTVSKEAL
jgi:hypothetical protein